MKRFGDNGIFLLCDESLTWHIVEDTGEVDTPVPEDIIAVLDSVKTVFAHGYGREYMDSVKTYVVPCSDSPTSFNDNEISMVGLTARGRYWCQYAFQFAHELCHLTIPGEVAQPYRWFEESICELASLFFLYEMTKAWETSPPCQGWKSYAPAFQRYVKSRLINNSLRIPDSYSFSSYFAERLSYLSDNCYDRSVNLLCAEHLLPIFQEAPAVWSDVPALAQWKTEAGLWSSLHQWKEEAHEKAAIEKIITLFYP